MAFVQRGNVSGLFRAVRLVARNHCTGAKVEKSVFISQSTDVHTNMALEQWIANRYDLSRHQVMLYYKNDPCVVLGNKANPWLDTNIAAQTEERTLALARRQGTGETTYQDQGTANVTFFGDSDHFDERYNLAVVKRGLFRKYGLKVQQEQEHLTYGNLTVSKTGTTVGEGTTYQNCSLFVDSDRSDLTTALQKEKNAKSNILNLTEVNRKITLDGVLSAIGWEYMRTTAYSLKDGGKELASQQRGFQMINPSEKWFPGINEIRDQLSNWDWCYGATPGFTISHTFAIPAHFLPNEPDAAELNIKVEVSAGRIGEITLFVPPGLSSTGFTGEAKVVTELRGHRFTEEALKKLEGIMGGTVANDKERFVTECVKRAMSSL